MPNSPTLALIMRRKYGIIVRSLAIALILVMIKYFAIEPLGLSIIPLSNLVTAFLGGVFFTIGIIFAGAATDFKEAEKMPGDLAALLKSLYKDTTVIPSDAQNLASIRAHLKELLSSINENFRNSRFRLKEFDVIIDKIYADLGVLSRKGVAPNFLIKMENDLTAIDRIAHRVDVIIETTFIPAAYTIAEIAIASMLFILLLLKTDPVYQSIIVLMAISLVLISLLALIKDMDSPFKGFAVVDLEILFSLESYWQRLGDESNPGICKK